MTDSKAYSPGEHLMEEVHARNWTISDLSEKMKLEQPVIHAIITGDEPITEDTANTLSEVLGTTPELWLNLERKFREQKLIEQHPVNLDSVLKMSKFMKELKIIDKPDSQKLLRWMVSELESLPINEEVATLNNQIRGFVLVGREWFPVHVMNYLRNNCVEFRSDNKDGRSWDQGICHLGRWADITADNMPCLPDEFHEMIGLKPEKLQAVELVV